MKEQAQTRPQPHPAATPQHSPLTQRTAPNQPARPSPRKQPGDLLEEPDAQHADRPAYAFGRIPLFPSDARAYEPPQVTRTGLMLQRQVAEEGSDDKHKAARDATYVAGHGQREVEDKLAYAMRGKIDVYVETFAEMLDAALNPNVGTMHIVGSGLEYFKNHKVTEEIRSQFLLMLHDKVEGESKNVGKAAEKYKPGLQSYGGKMWDFSAENLFSKGTWMIGKTYPEIYYEAAYKRVAKESWNVQWKAHWKFRENLDLRGGADQSDFYNRVAKPLGWLWHDVIGGRDPAPVHMDWVERGCFETFKATGTPIKPLSPGSCHGNK